MPRDQSSANRAFIEPVSQLLTQFISIQQELSVVNQQKRATLVSRDVSTIKEMSHRERTAQRKLTELLQQRQHLIENMNRVGMTGSTLHQICHRQQWTTEEPLKTKFEKSRALGYELRLQAWSIWTFANRAARYYQSAIEIIAQGGERDAVYQERTQGATATGGGSLLDASI